eukprot:gene1148-2665_t
MLGDFDLIPYGRYMLTKPPYHFLEFDPESHSLPRQSWEPQILDTEDWVTEINGTVDIATENASVLAYRSERFFTKPVLKIHNKPCLDMSQLAQTAVSSDLARRVCPEPFLVPCAPCTPPQFNKDTALINWPTPSICILE